MDGIRSSQREESTIQPRAAAVRTMVSGGLFPKDGALWFTSEKSFGTDGVEAASEKRPQWRRQVILVLFFLIEA